MLISALPKLFCQPPQHCSFPLSDVEFGLQEIAVGASFPQLICTDSVNSPLKLSSARFTFRLLMIIITWVLPQPPVKVYIRGPIKGYIKPYYIYCPTVTEGGQYPNHNSTGSHHATYCNNRMYNNNSGNRARFPVPFCLARLLPATGDMAFHSSFF